MISRSANTTWALVIAGIFAYTLATIARDPLRIHGDCALHIEAAERILKGGLPVVDAIDTNPPLIMYLTMVPTAVAHMIGSHPVPVFLVVMWLFTVAGTFAARQLLLTALAPREAIHANLLGVSLAVAWQALLDSNHYGQREHIFIVGVLPYLMVRFREWENIPTPRAAAIAAGIVAGIAASIKPQLAAIVIAPEIYWLVTRRTLRPLRRPEVMAAIGMAVAYLAHFLVVPAVGEAFFGRLVPMMVSGFAAYNISFGSIIAWHAAEWQPVAAAVLPFAFRARPEDVAWRIAPPLAVATVTAAAVYILQLKGWVYHALPIRVLAYALVGLVMAQLLTRTSDRESDPALTSVVPPRLVQIAIGAAVTIAIVGSLVTIGPTTRFQIDRLIAGSPLAREVATHTREGESVAMLSTSALDPYPLLVLLRRPQPTRFMFAFPVALLYHGVVGEPGQPFPYRGTNGVPSLAEETRYLDELKADVEKGRPKMVLIDAGLRCLGCPDGFSLHQYFERTGFLATALAAYSRSNPVDHFQVYLRKN